MHGTWNVAAGIDRGVPATTLQKRQVAVAVATNLLYIGKNVARAAIEKREPMPTRQCRCDEVRPEEIRSAEDQDIHSISPMLVLRCFNSIWERYGNGSLYLCS